MQDSGLASVRTARLVSPRVSILICLSIAELVSPRVPILINLSIAVLVSSRVSILICLPIAELVSLLVSILIFLRIAELASPLVSIMICVQITGLARLLIAKLVCARVSERMSGNARNKVVLPVPVIASNQKATRRDQIRNPHPFLPGIKAGLSYIAPQRHCVLKLRRKRKDPQQISVPE
jgi:hypothetical protein